MRTYILFAITILTAVGMGLVSVHPKEADSNAAAWLDLVGLSSWGEGFTAATDKQITIVLSFILAVCVVLMAIPTVRWVKRKFIVTKVPDPQRPELDRHPINRAYEHLMDVGVFEEDRNKPTQIAGLLRQAALDGEILIWGAEPSAAPVEWQTPILLAVDRDHWRHHGIDPVSLMFDASELPYEGCKTERESRPWDDQTECYWHLHVDMNQVRSKSADA